MNVDKVRETLIGNWISICCSTYIIEHQRLQRPLLELPLLVRVLKKMIENVINISEIEEEIQILQDGLKLLDIFDPEVEYIDLELNIIFLKYLKLLGEEKVKQHFDLYAKGLWIKAINGVKKGTEILKRKKLGK